MDKFKREQQEIYREWFQGRKVMAIQAVFVLPAFQRRGVGSALVRWACDLVSSFTFLLTSTLFMKRESGHTIVMLHYVSLSPR